jgi:hypothetical protein
MNVFDYVTSINQTKDNLMVDEVTEKEYVPFVVNRALSYFMDTCYLANEMNRLHHLEKKAQYQFLLSSIRPRKRFSGKWHKQEANSDIEAIQQYFQYSPEKARSVLPLLSVDDLKTIKDALNPGGVKGKK